MKTLFVGGNPDSAERLSVAVRLRWPNAEVMVANDADVGLEVVEEEQPDVVVYQASTGQTDTTFIQDLRAFSDTAMMVPEPVGGGGVIDEVKSLEAGADEYIRESSGSISPNPPKG